MGDASAVYQFPPGSFPQDLQGTGNRSEAQSGSDGTWEQAEVKRGFKERSDRGRNRLPWRSEPPNNRSASPPLTSLLIITLPLALMALGGLKSKLLIPSHFSKTSMWQHAPVMIAMATAWQSLQAPLQEHESSVQK